ncbi:MAG TPA: GyrI-like domain-containing protein [Candidatus Limnocylindrales bacterium]|jgi:effector-binding domain-containing protein|nr:GyrI-like domain-containing protein [Candidatus Limnocylindrales bacterium]
MEYHIERLEAQPVAVVRAHVAVDGIPTFLAGAFGEVIGVLAAQGLEAAGPPFARYGMSDRGFDVEAGFPSSAPVEPTGRVEAGELPGGPAIVILHRGSYDDVAADYRAGQEWLAANRWTATGAPWEVYLDGPEVAEPRTLVCMPCRPT